MKSGASSYDPDIRRTDSYYLIRFSQQVSGKKPKMQYITRQCFKLID
jgi:hypothetical protein